MENENWRNLVLSKTRIRDFSFSGERKSENSRFVENDTPRILVLWKTRIREFSFCGKPESENLFIFYLFFFYSRNLVLWKARIREFFFFIQEFSFCGKLELENSRFVENQNRKILFFWKIRIREFSFCGKREFLFCGKRELENSRFFFFFGYTCLMSSVQRSNQERASPSYSQSPTSPRVRGQCMGGPGRGGTC